MSRFETIDDTDLAHCSGGILNYETNAAPLWGTSNIDRSTHTTINNNHYYQAPPAPRSMVEWRKTPEGRLDLMRGQRPKRWAP